MLPALYNPIPLLFSLPQLAGGCHANYSHTQPISLCKQGWTAFKKLWLEDAIAMTQSLRPADWRRKMSTNVELEQCIPSSSLQCGIACSCFILFLGEHLIRCVLVFNNMCHFKSNICLLRVGTHVDTLIFVDLLGIK